MGGEKLNRGPIVVVIIIIIAVAAAGIFLVMSNSSNDTNNSNNTTPIIINNSTNNTPLNNNTTIISAGRAKEISNQFIGMGVYLGSAKLSKFNQTLVWNVTVYTVQNKYVDSIYIDAHTGKKIISPDEATQDAQQSTGMGVYLGTPTLKKVNNIQVWDVPVYTVQGKYVDSIYIDAHTGKKI